MAKSFQNHGARFDRRSLILGTGAALLLPATAQASQTQYLYDNLGRVVGVVYGSGAAVMYTYDAAGNRTQKTGPRITSDGFDPNYYLVHYPDIYYAGVDAYTHYMNTGWHEGRDPSAYFSTSGYLNAYSDVRNAGVNPLGHYSSNGWHEGRDPSTLFSTLVYLQNYGDVAAAGVNPYNHFLANGIYEGRQPFGTGSFHAPN